MWIVNSSVADAVAGRRAWLTDGWNSLTRFGHRTPVYNLLDLTPGGRGDWYAQLTYPDGPHRPLR